ncbi:hypothetical protein BDR26DRAFT_857190 [Obelidium mucronatum]|nr:hypothetical protein BDR26DRAFT_857190 [Obelidium mucronatum]
MATPPPLPAPCGRYYTPDFQQGNSVCIAPGRSMPACHSLGLGRDGGAYTLHMQFSGNLVLYRFSDGFISWASNTQNIESPDTNFFYSSDGNIGIFRQGAIVSTKNKIGDTWGSNGLFCLDVMEGVATLYNAGQASLTNPIWNSRLDGGYLVGGYPSTPNSPGPGPRIPISTAVVQQPPSPGPTITGVGFSTAASGIPAEKTGIASPSAPDNNSTTPKQSNGLGIGPIAGISVGVLLAFIGLGYFVYRSRKRNKNSINNNNHNNTTYSMAEMQKKPYSEIPQEKRDPVPQYIDYAASPEYVGNGSATYSVTAVPAFYRAIVDHEPLKHGQLRLKADMRVYVTAVDKNGWCKALVGREEGYVHATMLATLG